MSKETKIKHRSITSYVKAGTTLANTAVLLLHAFFTIFFSITNTTALFYFNIGSVVLYAFAYILLYYNKSEIYSILVNAEVFVFMIFATVCLGWEYGFQQYCIVFVVSLLFTDYSISSEHKLKKSTIAMILTIIVVFFALRLWTYFTKPIYVIPGDLHKEIFYIGNCAIAFAFLVFYSYLYSQTVFRLEKALVDIATKDALTGLYNRRKMHDLLNAMSELLATTSSNQICIAMLDIDNFKKINDTYGHDAGDQVLKSLAGILLEKQTESEGFQACRWGGEEFLVFYRKQRTNDEVVNEFEQLRKRISETEIVCNETKINITVTTGLAFYQEGTSITDTIKIADENLYKGKTSGKNVVIYH